MSDTPRDCIHGRLARSCEICDLIRSNEILRKAMPPAERLRNIALWFDYQYPGKSSEMQDTLRTWAEAIDRALEAA